jgi:hypothetical protein
MTVGQTGKKGLYRVGYRLFLGFCLLITAVPGRACDIPVFRYALENWPADPYRILVFYQQDLPPASRILLDSLRHSSVEGAANLALTTVDLSTPLEPPLRQLWDAQSNPIFPWIIATYPGASLSAPPVWSGPLTSSTVSELLDSPLRSECGRRLLQGETAVWILLESGRGQIDDAAAERLATHLAATERDLMRDTLYVEPEDPEAASRSALQPSFSLLRLSRADPAERILVAMLLNSEWDLHLADLPIAFPVFGRGRILYALVGDGISADNIHQACAFLVGDCSCQIKDQNPGTDLLTSIDWERHLADLPGGTPLPLVGMGTLAGLADPSIAKDEDEPSLAASGGSLRRSLLIILLTGAATVATATVLLKRRRS